MSRQTLTNYEVSIIKNLIRRKLENREIAGMINHFRGDPKKHISTGRITDIKKERTKRYIPINVATDVKADNFIELYKNRQSNHSSKIDPLSEEIINSKFPLSNDRMCFCITETESIECKNSISIPLKTVAAMANNRGGYLALGVKNATWEISGLTAEKIRRFDFNVWNQKIRNYFNIGLELSYVVKDYDGKSVIFIHIQQAHTKPIITSKNGEGLQDGMIYYRYPGEGRLITSTDLQNLIEKRVRDLSQTVLNKHISNIIEIGPNNAAVLDMTNGTLEGKSGSLILDEETLGKIAFIKEGEFVEKGGSPTLRLVGNVKKIADPIIREKDIFELYPISAKQLIKKVKENAQFAKEPEIYKIIKDEKIRENPKLAGYSFRNKRQRENYEQRGIKPSGLAPIYNLDAVDLIVEKLLAK